MRKWEVCRRAAAMALSMSLAAGGISPVIAAKADESTDDGYRLVWQDDFNGDSLNTNDWNIEPHEAGWVNHELQEYPDAAHAADNIKVQNGHLIIQPKATKKETAKPAEPEKTEDETGKTNEILKSNTFVEGDWDFGAYSGAEGKDDYQDGKAIITIDNPGTENWNVQLQKTGFKIKADHTYHVSVNASSSVDKRIEISVLDENNEWAGGSSAALGEVVLTPKEKNISFDFTFTPDAAKTYTDTFKLQLNMGKINSDDVISSPAVVTFSDVSLTDITLDEENEGTTASAVSGAAITEKEDEVSDYNITSGRINTMGKHDFTYGRFEARAKVPTGKGYLPAFWLMASDENLYGQWPKCGEIDIMEVMGQETDKSYHTIHYGYDADAGHRQNQGEYVTKAAKDFANDWHTYRVDWDPGKITWYVDDQEVYTTSDWYTGADDESQLTYPAPFDQNFYIILNLAVGGSWVTNPDMDIIRDMADQSYQIDYVKVYQKSPEEYAKEETQAKRPVKEVTFRQADDKGNFVLNSDFSKGVADTDVVDPADWQLHLEADGKGTTYTTGNGSITINPAATGSQNHSVQLKQGGVPMHRGWNYELSFKASASADRKMIVDIEGPDNGWTRYLKDTSVALTTDEQTYTLPFTMDGKSDANGCLEFNLGNQNSTDSVTISDVKLTHVSGEEIPYTVDKTVRSDGNYVYNGSFDQGDGRLGYWDVSDKDAVSVTNRNNDRKLQATVTVADKPVTVSQSGLAPFGTGTYELSFNAYTRDGAADGVKVVAAGNEFKPSLTATDTTFSYQFDTKNITRDGSDIAITFTKPGTYYLDNVAIRENAMIRNGSFDAGLAGFAAWASNSALNTFSVDSIKSGHTNAFDADIKDTEDEAWKVQLKQENITLEKGKKYKLTFDGRSTLDRQISVLLQENGGNWKDYSGTVFADLTDSWQTFTREFEMTEDTDSAAILNVNLGMINGRRITDEHHVYLDNFRLEEITDQSDPSTPSDPGTGTSGSGSGSSGSTSGSGSSGTGSTGSTSGSGSSDTGSTGNTSGSGSTDTGSTGNTSGSGETGNGSNSGNQQNTDDPTGGNGDTETRKDTGKKTVTVSKNTTSIGNGAYAGNKTVTKVTLKGTKVTSVGKNAFANCSNLKSIDLSKQKKLTTIGANAFKNCKNLKTIKINVRSLKKVSSKAFTGCKNTKSVKVTLYAKNRKQFNNAVKMLRKAGLSKVTYKYVKR